MISSTLGGSGGCADTCSVADARNEIQASSPAIGDPQQLQQHRLHHTLLGSKDNPAIVLWVPHGHNRQPRRRDHAKAPASAIALATAKQSPGRAAVGSTWSITGAAGLPRSTIRAASAARIWWPHLSGFSSLGARLPLLT
jgi:hypothetical protein